MSSTTLDQFDQQFKIYITGHSTTELTARNRDLDCKKTHNIHPITPQNLEKPKIKLERSSRPQS
jgi:hypothetical protein